MRAKARAKAKNDARGALVSRHNVYARTKCTRCMLHLHVFRKRTEQIMAHAGQNAIAVIQDTIFRRNGTRATIAALEGNNTNAMAAFEF